ncbi:hypothetical protein BT96DRAFT_744910, partial [Gymnopus androsaceus JB14]
EFNLNEEQEHAFRIVAQHSIGHCNEPLPMYIEGMGGTGKSQVVKCLLINFGARDNAYAIVTCAPTGNAAALLGGSTYHFLLGMNNKVEEVAACTMAQVCSRLDGVQYIILDEVSMLSCIDMYKISERL